MSFCYHFDVGMFSERKVYFINKYTKILHREDGPAIEYFDGVKFYFLNGKKYSEQNYWAIIKFGAFI